MSYDTNIQHPHIAKPIKYFDTINLNTTHHAKNAHTFKNKNKK
jgi:hypothetical protein